MVAHVERGAFESSTAKSARIAQTSKRDIIMCKLFGLIAILCSGLDYSYAAAVRVYTGSHIYETLNSSACVWDVPYMALDCTQEALSVRASDYLPAQPQGTQYSSSLSIYFADTNVELYFRQCSIVLDNGRSTLICLHSSDEIFSDFID